MAKAMKKNYKKECNKITFHSSSDLLVNGFENFDGLSVMKVVPIKDSNDCLVLLDPGSSKQQTFENLLRVDKAGIIVWRAKLPHSHDVFVNVVTMNEGIEARTWNGMKVLVNVADGSCQEIGFTK
jgi:hypothetical protein